MSLMLQTWYANKLALASIAHTTEPRLAHRWTLPPARAQLGKPSRASAGSPVPALASALRKGA